MLTIPAINISSDWALILGFILWYTVAAIIMRYKIAPYCKFKRSNHDDVTIAVVFWWFSPILYPGALIVLLSKYLIMRKS